ncbi:MAG: hypothetical protein IT323_22235 [Anaerolineae bacterium]|nr:hypothetical protein [Anaerolineae bacterium]
MRTPAGKECPEYYQDFHRQRNIQECRLAKRNPDSARWQPGDCRRCPVPDILRANASPHLRLKLTIRPGFLGIGRSNLVQATCEKHRQVIEDPYVGCEQCNAERPGLSAFIDALEGQEHDQE